jgi:hypothetical protein
MNGDGEMKLERRTLEGPVTGAEKTDRDVDHEVDSGRAADPDDMDAA